jgi:hypothetical protein
MIEVAGETFIDEKEADAWMNVLLELKFNYGRSRLEKLSFKNKKELYKRAKRRGKK